ncbi:MAG: ABZJ_00895 family protein [Pseudomonadota bacterium]
MSPPSINLLRYALWFAGSSLVVLTFVLIFQQAFGITLGSAFVPIIPAMIAAMVEGSHWAKGSREPMPQPWKAAGTMTGIAVLITGVLILATTPSALGMGLEGLRVVAILLVVYAIFWLVTNRLFLYMGARNEWANQDRRRG